MRFPAVRSRRAKDVIDRWRDALQNYAKHRHARLISSRALCAREYIYASVRVRIYSGSSDDISFARAISTYILLFLPKDMRAREPWKRAARTAMSCRMVARPSALSDSYQTSRYLFRRRRENDETVCFLVLSLSLPLSSSLIVCHIRIMKSLVSFVASKARKNDKR